MKRDLVIFCLASLVTVNVAAAENKEEINDEPGHVTASASWGRLNETWTQGIDAGGKYQLDKAEFNTPIVKADIAWDTFSWLTFNARGYSTLSSSHAKEDVLGNARLEYARQLDANLKLWLIKHPSFRLGAVAGYQQTQASLSDDSDFNFPFSRSGSTHKLSLPYVGVAAMYRFHNFELNALAKYSTLVKSQEEFNFNNLTVKDKTNDAKNSKYYSATVNAGVYITPNTKLFAEASWNKFDYAKTDYVFNDNETATVNRKNEGHNVSVGLQYRF
jgi:plasminogen activator